MELSVKINAAIDSFVSAMKQAQNTVAGVTNAAAKPIPITADTSQAQTAIKDLSEKVKGAASGLGGVGQSLLGVFGGGVLLGGVSGIVGGFDKMISKGIAAIEMQENMKVAFRASGLSVEESEKALKKNAKATGELSDKYAVSKKDINEATAAFLRFGGSSDNLKAKQENIIGLAAKLGGNYELAARALAKATDPEIEGQLTKFGIKFEKNATEADRQRVITEKLGGTLEGLAEKADTPLGKMQRVQNTIGGIASTLGVAIIEAVAPIVGLIGDVVLPLITATISALKAAIGGIKSFFAENSAAIKVVLTVIGTAAVIAAGVLYGSLIPSVIASAASFVMMGVSAAAAWIAVNAPIILIVAGIAALAAGIMYLYNNFEAVRNVVETVRQIAVAVFDGLIQYAKDYWEILKAVGEIVFNVLILPFKLLWAVLSPVISAIGDFISSFFSLSDSGKEAGGVIDYVKGAFQVLHNVMSFVISALKGVIAGISTFAETATKVIDKVMHLDFSGAVDAAKEGGKKIGDSTAGAFNESMKEIKSKEAAKKFEEDFKAAAAAVQAAIVSIDASKLGESFDAAKKKAGENVTSSIAKLSGIQVAFEKLAKAQSEDLPERAKALADFIAESGAQNVTSYEQAKALAKQTAAELKKTQAESLADGRKMKAIENSNSIEFANKERQINEQTALRKKTDDIEQNKQSREKIARDTLQSEMDLNIQLLQIQGEADAAKFTAQIASAQKLLALKLDLTPAQKKAELQSIAQIQTAKDKAESDNLLKIQAERAKFAVKDYEESQKAIVERLKLESEFAKKTVELTEKRTVATTEQELGKQADLINAKLDLVQAGYVQELNDLLAKNASVVKAESALKNALAKGNDENTAKAKAELEIARNDAIANDALVLELRKKSNEELVKIQKESAAALSAFRISLITDDADREREVRLLEIKKTFDAELLAAAGNERLILDAHRKANAARYDSDEEYNRKTTDLATRTANTLQNLGMGIADGIAEMYGNTFNDLSKAFDDYAAGVQKKLEKSNGEDVKKLEDETKTLRTQLAKREISYQDFQEKITALRKEDSEVTATERANLAIGKSFQKLGKNAQEDLQGVFAKMKTSAKAGENVWDTFSKNSADVFAGMATTLTGTLGAMAAAGTLTLKEVGKAAVGIALDTAGNVAMSQAPVILAAAMTPPPTGLGPIFGAIAGVAAIASIQALIAITKGAIGADQGVVGIDGSYSTPRSSRDTIPIWVRDGESIINPEATAQNRALLKFINSTNRPASEFFSNSVVTANGNLQLAHSNQIRTAQLVTAGNSPNSQDFGAMQNSLANIERSLATAKILETRSKHTSAVQLTVTENRAYKIQQEKAALKLERARR